MPRRKIPLKYTTVRVPVQVRDAIKELAMKTHESMWQAVYHAVTYYRAAYSSGFKENVTEVGKIAWYCYKIAASIGEFKQNPSKENGALLQKTAQQLADRFGIDIGMLKAAAVKYFQDPSEENRIMLNDAGKDIVAQLISRLAEIPEKEEGEAKS